MARLCLPHTTLCAVAGRLVVETVAALERSMSVADFGDCLLLSDRKPPKPLPEGVRLVLTPDLGSRERYSHVIQRGLAEHIATPFVMIVQWDGYPRRAENWTDEFLAYDYIGAPWPQFSPPLAVGNGGFSLRSQRLLRGCLDPRFRAQHPEDISICHRNRELLEQQHGVRFAPPDLAMRFSCERAGDPSLSFGFHGVFNMPREMGISDFLKLFRSLDRSAIGSRELRDLRDALRSLSGSDGDRAARAIMQDLVRREWYRPGFWRYSLKKSGTFVAGQSRR